MTKNIDNNIATNTRNELAQEYYNFVNEKLKDKIDSYLQTNGVKPKDIPNRIKDIESFYIKMFNIQYRISQITPNTILEYYKSGSKEISKINVNAIDKQATNWLNRLSSTLNVLTIKSSEFSERKAKHRDFLLFSLSIFFSTILGFFVNACFDKQNDIDLDKQTLEIKKHHDSISNEIKQDYNLNFDTLKCNANQKLLK